ncbi:ribonuclease E inhibitor RraB [Gracilimonas sediminicola]|uniref:Ribonuclease E inhibitor RraB n=1 Tax=Gracilimonas sediminicola TaxID=2952158 RepID=A0A9X2RE17_9BACT|nr:ribonuclease E inhibitor RraB [Gracilimonas sediminicola]MCP9291686.1 ribonuclease E inhibitor RraB [Gracilimonas sediminicola]
MSRPKEIDAKVVEHIIRFGGDIDKEKPVDFFFYFPTEYAASQVEVKLLNLGFSTDLHYLDKNKKWSLSANKIMKISTDRIYELGLWFNKIAEEQGGEYDGWGAPI